MAKTTTRKTATRGTGKTTQRGGGKTPVVSGDFERVTPTPKKVVDQLLMLAADDVGLTFYVNKASVEFFVPLDDPNYAAMSSLLFSAHSGGAAVAVKYTEPAVSLVSKRRRATAVAKGVHAVISGGSF